MQIASQPHMGKECEICGDIGFDVAIIICHVCKSSREHAYCMPNYKGDVPQVWTCEECDKGTTNSEVPASQGRDKWIRKPKTMLLSEFEARQLQSGTISNLPRDKVAPTVTRTPLKASRPSPDAQKFSPPKPKTGYSSYLQFEPQTSQASKCQVLISKEAKKLTQTSEQRGFVHPQKNVNTNIDPPLKSIAKCAKDIETANREVRKESGEDDPVAEKRILTNILPLRGFIHPQKNIGTNVDPPPKSIGKRVKDIETTNGEIQKESGEDVPVAEKRILTNILPQALPSDPALHPSWKGTFSITSSTLLTNMLQHDIQAHPRSRVPRKMYEFFKKMPQVLEFKIVPRQTIWSDLYPNQVYDCDIGLYFFPTDSNRNEKFIQLLHLVSGADLVMRTLIDGVELLVFASGCLPEDSRTWNGDEFLWGAFHAAKEADRVTVEAAKLPPCTPLLDESEDVDMEIDMEGGSQVGKVDVIISRKESNDAVSPPVPRPVPCAGIQKLSYLDPPPPPPGFENTKFMFTSPIQVRNPEVMGRGNSAVHVKVKTEIV